MAVTTQQFEAMTPQTYQAVRRDLQSGDVMLFHSSDVSSQMIEHFTDSLWSHAAMLLRLNEIDRVLIMECVPGAGVRMMPLSTRINGIPGEMKPYQGKLLVARHRDFPSGDAAKVRTLAAIAMDRLGFPYSSQELVKIGERIAASLVGRVLPGSLSENDRYICSEFVAMCFQEVGITLRLDREGFMAPADIALDEFIEGVFSLRPDQIPVLKAS